MMTNAYTVLSVFYSMEWLSPLHPQGNHGLVLDITASGKYQHRALPANGKRLLFYSSFILWNGLPPGPPPPPTLREIVSGSWTTAGGKCPHPRVCTPGKSSQLAPGGGGGEVRGVRYRGEGLGISIKGSLTRDFRIQVFVANQVPPGVFFLELLRKFAERFTTFGSMAGVGNKNTGDNLSPVSVTSDETLQQNQLVYTYK